MSRKTYIDIKIPKMRPDHLLRFLRNYFHKLVDFVHQRAKEKAPDQLKKAWLFRTMGDERVCPKCAKLEGALFDSDDDRYTPPIHARCRCYQEELTINPWQVKKDSQGGEIIIKHPRATSLEFGTETTKGKEGIGAHAYMRQSINEAKMQIQTTFRREFKRFFDNMK